MSPPVTLHPYQHWLLWYLNFNHFDTWVVYPIAALIADPLWHDAECLHMLSCYLSCSSSARYLLIFPPFLNWIVCFSCCWVLEFFFYYYFRGKSFIRYVFCKYFSQSIAHSLFSEGALYRTGFLILIQSNIHTFFFL